MGGIRVSINKKLLSSVVSAIFVLSTITAPVGKLIVANAKASDGSATISYLESTKAQAKDKIQKTLISKFTTDTTKVTYLVKLKDQVDTTNVAENAASKAKKQGLSAYKTKLLKKSTIVSELKIKADETQSSVKTYLDSEKKNGNVSKYEDFWIVNGLSVTGTKAVMEKLAAMPEVESICAENIEQLTDTSSTASKSSVTSANTPSTDNVEPNIRQISAPEAWQMGYTGTGIVVASIDTGVQWDHPALVTKYRGYNASNPTVPNNECNWFDATAGQSAPYDDIGHGTHTMGTMVGSCADGTNQVGVAPGAKWITAKAFTSQGGTDTALLACGQWMMAPVDSNGNTHPELAPDIINNSWGGGPGVDDWFRQMVINWKAAGIFPEFSAGNVTTSNPGGPGSVATPGSYPESFTTGAVDANNNLASFSLRGPSPYGGVLKPDVSAPGVNIRSSVPGSSYDGTYSGTSMAGPHVCGTAALVMQANSSLTIDQIENAIKNTATPRTDSEYPDSPNNGYGYGVINAFLAVSSVTNGVGQIKGHVVHEGQDTVPPTFTETITTDTFLGMDIPITVNAQDDVSIKTVELQYVHNTGDTWATIAATQTDGDYRGGDYTATIPASDVTGTSLQYRWRIVDYGDHEVFSDTHTITIHSGITDGYFTDFETQPAGWSTSGTSSWQWGVPTGGIGRAASGSKVYATNLAGTYANNTNTVLEMPPIDLPSGNSYLNFKHWYYVENGFDNCYVQISTDNTNWSNLAHYTGNLGNDYANVQIDLSAYAGQRVYIQFKMTSDSSVTNNGWFIDDVALSNQSASSAAVKSVKNIVNTTPNAEVSSLPLSGTVTVLENGASVNTNPGDGSYTMTQGAGDYTLQAESYGYYPATQAVHVTRDTVTDNVNFNLQPIPKGIVTGKITNAQTGDPIANAKLYLIEDAAVAPVYTDSDGNYSINAYEGNYTLQIMAGNYYSQQVAISITGNQSTTKDIQMRPFIGYSGLISYDNGTAEDATGFYAAGNGWGVHMTLPDGKNSAMLTAGIFKFWDTVWPNPGATPFKVAVYSAAADGTPGTMIAGPYDGTAVRDKTQWTTVDLSSYGITVPHDFYLVYIQEGAYPNCPGIGCDEDGPNAYRTYQLVNGAFSQYTGYGNIMIRAAVSYEAQAPVINTPQNNLYTNNGTLTVSGTACPNLNVQILNNNAVAATVMPDDNGNFSSDITLTPGNNAIKACTVADNGRTDYCSDINVIYDNVAPVLSVTSPADNLKTNKEAITVQGTVIEENLDSIIVNGIKAQVNSDGTWSARIVLNEGANTIETVAADKAGNTTTKTLTVYAKFGIQAITNLLPDKDMRLNTGKTVKIEFDCEPGLKTATFSILMPLTNYAITGGSAVELPMTEVLDANGNGTGHYIGYWTVPSKLKLAGAQIQVKATDWYGNTLTKYASGKLYINVPVPHI